MAPELLGPSALPVLVTTPKKVTKEWANEIRAAWPQAEVLFIKDYHDVAHWMQRCASSPAPAVIGIFSHSTSRAFGRAWQPVVHEKKQTTTVPDLEPDAALKEALEAVYDRRHRLVAYQFKETGQVLTKDITTSFFYCPDCLGRIEATPERCACLRQEGQYILAGCPQRRGRYRCAGAGDQSDLVQKQAALVHV